MARRRNASRRSQSRVRGPTAQPPPQPSASAVDDPVAGSRRLVASRSGVRSPAGSGPGSSPGQPLPPGPPSGSSSDAWRCPHRWPRDARTGHGCSATSHANWRMAASTTAICSPSPSGSTPSSRPSPGAVVTPPAGRRDIPARWGDKAIDPRHRRVDAFRVRRHRYPTSSTPRTRIAAGSRKVRRPFCHQTVGIGAFSHGRSVPAVVVRPTPPDEEDR
jgi:hypothetical protein